MCATSLGSSHPPDSLLLHEVANFLFPHTFEQVRVDRRRANGVACDTEDTQLPGRHASQGFDRAFRGSVDRLARQSQWHSDTGHVDNARRRGFTQQTNRGLAQHERPQKVRFHDTACHLHGRQRERIHIGDAGIVDQRIEPAHFSLHITQQCVHGLRIRHIDTIMPIMLMGDDAFRRCQSARNR